MSSNHLHLVYPNAIKIETSDSYAITNVSPVLIDNDDIVYVTFSSTSPGEGDWIGAYSPPNADVTSTAPIKFGYCDGSPYSTYLTSGAGQLAFNLTNMRSGVSFKYFTSGTLDPVLVANSSSIVEFKNINQPLRNRIVATGDHNVYNLLWSSATSSTPVLKWGIENNTYIYTSLATSSTITKSSLCSGGAATSTGWHELGLIHTANFTGIVDAGLSSKMIYYIFGDESTGDFSLQQTFHVPPLPGTQPPDRPTQVVLLADLGVGSWDDSYDTTVWDEPYPPAANTSMSIGYRVMQGEIDAIFHSGDISYANGYLASWDFFLDQISPFSGSAVYLTTVGNHESDWPDSASLYNETASGGECGVVSFTMLPMPPPAVTNQPWWSYEIGLIHFVGISAEHDYSTGSPQLQWLQTDLAAVNRSITPWIIVSGHRSLYVDSKGCCANFDDDDCGTCIPDSDIGCMETLQKYVEPLLFQYQVNLYFAGHFHNLQRQSATYQGEVVQRAALVYDADGNAVYRHDNPQATVHITIGAAGAGPNDANKNYSWSEKYWNGVYGYTVVTAINSSSLYWELINSANDDIIDRVLITQDGEFDGWAQSNSDGGGSKSSSSSSGGSEGWKSLTEAEQVVIVTFSLIGLLLLAVVIVIIGKKFINHQSLSSSGMEQNNNQTNQAGCKNSSEQFELSIASDPEVGDTRSGARSGRTSRSRNEKVRTKANGETVVSAMHDNLSFQTL